MNIIDPGPRPVHVSDDICALPLVRRLGATLDHDASTWRDGDALPRGWHLALFSTDTPQSALRKDGVASFDVGLPDLGLPRLVFGGRRIHFHGDIPIGAGLRRESRLLSVQEKSSRGGRLAVATVQHQLFLQGASRPVLEETHDLIMREAASETASSRPAVREPPGNTDRTRNRDELHRKMVTPDEMLLFRVAAVMFNAHRIHFDLPYATAQEGYPGLVVNASVTALLLIEFLRQQTQRQPDTLALRNVGLAFCGRPLLLCARPVAERSWHVWAQNDAAEPVVEGHME